MGSTSQLDAVSKLNSGRVYPVDVGADAAGEPLIDFLATRYSHTSRDAWAQHCTAGRVSIGGQTAASDAVLRAGDRVEYHRPPWHEPVAPRWLWSLHRDEHVLVLCKPSGLPVLPSELFYESTVLSLLRRQHREIQPVHRLGVGTSGVLLCARSALARRALAMALEARQVKKTYRALVQGLVEPDELTIGCPIGPVRHASLSGSCQSIHAARPEGGPGAKAAMSHLRVVARDAARGTSLLEVTIPTGRPHQIRIHTAVAGHPLVGDPLYAAGGLPRREAKVGDGDSAGDGDADADADTDADADASEAADRPPLPRDTGYLLHAWRVEFPHPATGEAIMLHAPPPAPLCVAGETPLEEAAACALRETPADFCLGDDDGRVGGLVDGHDDASGESGGAGVTVQAVADPPAHHHPVGRRKRGKGARSEAEIAAIRAERAAKRQAAEACT